MEESADDDEKISEAGDDKNTNRNTGGTENGKETKTSCGQDLEKQEMDEELVSSEAAAKGNTTEENKDTEEEDMKENNLNTNDTPNSQNDSPQDMKTTTNTGGLLLFGVGGIRNKNK